MLRQRGFIVRRAFSIAEMVFSVAVLAILAAIVIPSIAQYAYDKRIQLTADILDSLGIAKINFANSLGKYPGRLSHLGTIPKLVDESDCSGISPTTLVRYTASDTAQWGGTVAPEIAAPVGRAGPYYPHPIPRTGIQLPIGIANDQLIRTTNNTTAGFLQITIPGVNYADALALNTKVDGGGLAGANRADTSGTVRWAAPGAGDLVTITWNMGVRNVC